MKLFTMLKHYLVFDLHLTSEQGSTSVVKSPLVEAEGSKELAILAYKSGKFGEAINLYTRAIQLDPSKPVYRSGRAAAYKAIKKFHLALEDYQQAYALQVRADAQSQGSDPILKTLCHLAWCHFYLASFTACLSTLRILLTLVAQSSSASSGATSIHNQAILLQNKATVLANNFHAFHAYRRNKKWAEASLALTKCLQGIEAEGGEVPGKWWIWKTELEIGMGDWHAAESTSSHALRLNPTSCDTLHICGLLFFLTGNFFQSTHHLVSALDLDPNHEPSCELRVRVKEVERLKEEGNTLFRAKIWPQALGKYEKALEKVGSADEHGGGGLIRAILLSNRATTLVKMSQYQEALVDIQSSLRLCPTSFKALRTCARTHFHLSNYDICIASYHSAIENAQLLGVADVDLDQLRAELKGALELQNSQSKDYHNILGVSRGCNDQREIRKAYRRQSKLHHPDKGGDEERFKLVLEAYQVLSNPVRHNQHDLVENEGGSNR